jgi:hypothetical protein
MTTVPWKIDEERRFLEDTSDALGERAARAIAAVGRRLDLDYAGIDFTVLQDGRVPVFEANATMPPSSPPTTHRLSRPITETSH